MNDRFIKVDNSNSNILYEEGYMERGCLVRYRWAATTLHSYGLDDNCNQWQTGIVSHVHRISFMRNSLQIKIEDNVDDHLEFIHDLIVFTCDPSIPMETISLETHEIYLNKHRVSNV